jgi:hypothetical protein
MIANTVFDSFYIAEFEGEAIKDFICGDFDIAQIAFASAPFSSDLAASIALDSFINDVALNIDGDYHADVKMDYNPVFFPTIKQKELTLEEELDLETLQEEADKSSDPQHIAVILTRLFDPMGDFIESRITITAENFKMIGKIGVNPDEFLASLGEIKKEEMNMFISARPPCLTMGIH